MRQPLQMEQLVKQALKKRRHYDTLCMSEFQTAVEDVLEKQSHGIPTSNIKSSSTKLYRPVEVELWPSQSLDLQSETVAYNAKWLQDQLDGISSALSSQDLMQQIFVLLEELHRTEKNLTDTSIERCQVHLAELLGFEHLEMVSLILQNSNDLFRSLQKQRQSQRQRKKEAFSSITPAAKEPSIKPLAPHSTPSINLPHVYGTQSTLAQSINGILALPSGTLHLDSTRCEEYILPHHTAPSEDVKNQIAPVEISSLPAFCHAAFGNYTHLNRMQSAVCETLISDHQNVLVCAPTGAGKTDIAMLSILRVLMDHHQAGFDRKNTPPLDFNIDRKKIRPLDFKIVYLAPMKALAAEITAKFAKRLKSYGVMVREYTGDMQLSRAELIQTHMLVSTPEKWDVVTRKGSGVISQDNSEDHFLISKVRLIIIDEVHLLQDDRGAVLEAVVTRTLRSMQVTQRLVRIVGLSATLPNYIDVATFLHVNPYTGLFVFGDAFRPVPLTQRFVGIKGRSHSTIRSNMDSEAFDRVCEYLRNGHQVMVFVHSRNETANTVKTFVRMAREAQVSNLFQPEAEMMGSEAYLQMKRRFGASKNSSLHQFFNSGMAIHHAGMLRSDRSLSESAFSAGFVRLLVCTSTLAWGVNLPAHAVLIKGTKVYDSSKGDFSSLGVLDVLQIFGRAGRPQFEEHGEGVILTEHSSLTHYIRAVTAQVPIESRLLSRIEDCLMAEISLGTVRSVSDALCWLKLTYLHVRMSRNPPAYGLKLVVQSDALEAMVHDAQVKIVSHSLRRLQSAGMLSLSTASDQSMEDIDDEEVSVVSPRDVGRIASRFYIQIDTVETWGERFHPLLSVYDALLLVASSSEFKQLRVREEELPELESLSHSSALLGCQDLATAAEKASLLIQVYISAKAIDSSSLHSDYLFVQQSAGRVMRALFEMAKAQRWTVSTLSALDLCRMYERQCWLVDGHPLVQYHVLSPSVLEAISQNSISSMRRMKRSTLDQLGQGVRGGELLEQLLAAHPEMSLNCSARRWGREILQIQVSIERLPGFKYHSKYSHDVDRLWIIVERKQTSDRPKPLNPNKAFEKVRSVSSSALLNQGLNSAVHQEWKRNSEFLLCQSVAMHRNDTSKVLDLSLVLNELSSNNPWFTVHLLFDQSLHLDASVDFTYPAVSEVSDELTSLTIDQQTCFSDLMENALDAAASIGSRNAQSKDSCRIHMIDKSLIAAGAQQDTVISSWIGWEKLLLDGWNVQTKCLDLLSSKLERSIAFGIFPHLVSEPSTSLIMECPASVSPRLYLFAVSCLLLSAFYSSTICRQSRFDIESQRIPVMLVARNYQQAVSHFLKLQDQFKSWGIEMSLFDAQKSTSQSTHLLIVWPQVLCICTNLLIDTIIIDTFATHLSAHVELFLSRSVDSSQRVVLFCRPTDLCSLKQLCSWVSSSSFRQCDLLRVDATLCSGPLSISIEGMVGSFDLEQSRSSSLLFTMNRPVFDMALDQLVHGQAELKHNRVLVCCPNARDVESTIRALMALGLSHQDQLKSFVSYHQNETDDLHVLASTAENLLLRDAIVFGVAILNEHLSFADRRLALDLFGGNSVGILISSVDCLAQLSPSLTASLVVAKGIDVDYDTLIHLLSRCSAPQDNTGNPSLAKTVILVSDRIKPVITSMLMNPVPIESELISTWSLHDDDDDSPYRLLPQSDDTIIKRSFSFEFFESSGPKSSDVPTVERLYLTRRMVANGQYYTSAYGIRASDAVNVIQWVQKHVLQPHQKSKSEKEIWILLKKSWPVHILTFIMDQMGSEETVDSLYQILSLHPLVSDFLPKIGKRIRDRHHLLCYLANAALDLARALQFKQTVQSAQSLISHISSKD